jgi:hypothetical protein
MPMRKVANDGPDEVKRLREEIFWLRQTIHALLPVEVARVLSSYHHCESLEDAHRWTDNVAEQISDFAEPRPAGEMGELGPGERAYCPLCKASSQSPYAKGFAFPEGLLKHLLGQGNARECLVMRAARVAARDYVQDEFSQQHLRRVQLDRQPAKTRKMSPKRGS